MPAAPALAPRLPPARGAAVLALGAGLATGSILGGVAAAEWLASEATPHGADAIYAVAIAVPLMLCATIAGWLTRIGVFAWGPAPGSAMAGWALLGLGGVALAGAIGAAAGGDVHNLAPLHPALLVGVALVLLQSAAEEVFLRGWLQPALARHWPPAAAIVASALLFALLHVLGGARAPLSLVNLTLGGVLFGLLAMRTGGLAVPIAAHAAWNAGEQFLLGLDPNPGVGSFGALIDLDLTGPVIWGGSAEGLNASIAMTLVLAGMIGVARILHGSADGD